VSRAHRPVFGRCLPYGCARGRFHASAGRVRLWESGNRDEVGSIRSAPSDCAPASIFGAHVGQLSPNSVAIALLGALTGAAHATVRKLGSLEHPAVIVFYHSLVTFPIASANWLMPAGGEWLLLLGVGMSTQLAQTFITRGLQVETAVRRKLSVTRIVADSPFGAQKRASSRTPGARNIAPEPYIRFRISIDPFPVVMRSRRPPLPIVPLSFDGESRP